MVNLSWTAATDNVAVTGYRVERCQGAGCSNFAEIAQPTGTTFSDSGQKRLDELLLPRARDRRRPQPRPLLRDRNRDDAGRCPTRQPPTAPTNLSATAVELDPGQPLVDGRDRQRRGHRLPGGALPGCRLLQLRGDRASRPGRRTRIRPAAPRRATPTACAPSTRPPTSAPTRRPQPRRRRPRPRHQARSPPMRSMRGRGRRLRMRQGVG